jgi:hypothetical protein
MLDGSEFKNTTELVSLASQNKNPTGGEGVQGTMRPGDLCDVLRWVIEQPTWPGTDLRQDDIKIAGVIDCTEWKMSTALLQTSVAVISILNQPLLVHYALVMAYTSLALAIMHHDFAWRVIWGLHGMDVRFWWACSVLIHSKPLTATHLQEYICECVPTYTYTMHMCYVKWVT